MHARIIVILFSLWFSFALSVHAQEQSTTDQFTKLNDQGRELAQDAPQWSMVRDNASGLIWEVKTKDGSIHDMGNTYDWQGAHDAFIDELNQMQFGGVTDWRLPTTDELRTIRVKGSEPYINLDFFPNTVSTSYMSWRLCGNGEIYDERVKFGKVRNTKKNRMVRAVRGGTEQAEK